MAGLRTDSPATPDLSKLPDDVMLLLVERNLLMDSDVESVAAASAAKPFIRVAQSLKKSGRRLSPFAAATCPPLVPGAASAGVDVVAGCVGVSVGLP